MVDARRLEVDTALLANVPPMFEDLAEGAEQCRAYAEVPYAEMDMGPGPLRNVGAGIINQLTFTHNRIRAELQEYFSAVHTFTAEQGDKVADAVHIYETTEWEIAVTLDQSLFSQPLQDAVREMGGRSPDLMPDSRIIEGPHLPGDPASELRPLTDYRAEHPYVPNFRHPLDATSDLSLGTFVRDVIWHATSLCARFGLCEPLDIVSEIVIPFTGDWAGLKACGDALHNLDGAVDHLYGGTRWVADWINACWQGNAADACWLRTRQLENSLLGARTPLRVLRLYGDAYHDVVDEVKNLERIAEGLILELLDWGATVVVATIPVVGPFIAGFNNIWDLVNPPDSLVQKAMLANELRETVLLALQAVFSFNARCALGALVPVNGALPAVPEPSALYG
jgi:hypothetical protein